MDFLNNGFRESGTYDLSGVSGGGVFGAQYGLGSSQPSPSTNNSFSDYLSAAQGIIGTAANAYAQVREVTRSRRDQADGTNPALGEGFYYEDAGVRGNPVQTGVQIPGWLILLGIGALAVVIVQKAG